LEGKEWGIGASRGSPVKQHMQNSKLGKTRKSEGRGGAGCYPNWRNFFVQGLIPWNLGKKADLRKGGISTTKITTRGGTGRKKVIGGGPLRLAQTGAFEYKTGKRSLLLWSKQEEKGYKKDNKADGKGRKSYRRTNFGKRKGKEIRSRNGKQAKKEETVRCKKRVQDRVQGGEGF